MSRNGATAVARWTMTTADVLGAVEDGIVTLDEVRSDLANVYAQLPTDGSGHPEAEFEIGESLQAVRKAYTRLRKARGVLAQQTLPRGDTGNRGRDEEADE